MIEEQTMSDVITGYLVCMLWTMPPDGEDENPGDSISIHELPAETWEIARKDCAAFVETCGELFMQALERPGYTAERFGHDFALKRNGHGAGFWDRAELSPDDMGDKLSALCGWTNKGRTRFAENNLYLGDDGLAYFEMGAA